MFQKELVLKRMCVSKRVSPETCVFQKESVLKPVCVSKRVGPDICLLAAAYGTAHVQLRHRNRALTSLQGYGEITPVGQCR